MTVSNSDLSQDQKIQDREMHLGDTYRCVSACGGTSAGLLHVSVRMRLEGDRSIRSLAQGLELQRSYLRISGKMPDITSTTSPFFTVLA